MHLQSWTKLVESDAVTTGISQFPCMETPTRSQKGFPPPSSHSMLFGRTEVSSGEFWWQSDVDKGERGERFVVVSGFQGQSSHSFQSVSSVLSF